MSQSGFVDRHCVPCEGGVPTISSLDAEVLLSDLAGWHFDGKRIEKTFTFKNHYENMAFVNAIAWISHREDHHPELTIGYRDCRVRYWTHAIDGLSENDFICAGKLEKMLVL